MNPSSKNPLELQNELVKSVNNPYVTEGRPSVNNITHPAVESPMKTVPNKDGHYDIVDSSGHVVGHITGAIFGLAESVVNTVKNVGNGIVDAGTSLVSAATDTISNVSHSLVNGVSSTVKKSVTTGSELVSDAANTVGDVSKHIITGTSNGLSNSIGNLRNSILNTEGPESNNSLNNIKASLFASRHSLKVASEKLSTVLSVPNPDPVELKVATAVVNSHIATEVSNLASPNDEIKKSSVKVASVLNNPTASNQEIKEANESLKEYLSNNSLNNIQVSVLAPSAIHQSVLVSRNSLKEASRKLEEVLSVPVPDPVEVKIATAVAEAQIKSELINPETPNDVVKQSASKLATVIENNENHESIKQAAVTLRESLGNNSLANIQVSMLASNVPKANIPTTLVLPSRHTLKEASKKLEEVLSVPEPNPVEVKLATSIVETQIKSELVNPETPNDEVKQSATKLATIIQNNESNESIKQATVTLNQSLGNNSLNNIQVSSVPNPSALASRHSLHESSKVLLNELSKAEPNQSIVKSASQVLKSHLEMEVQQPNTPHDEVKSTAQQLVTVLEDPQSNNQSIQKITQSLHDELEHQKAPTILSTIASGIKTVANGVGSVAHGVVQTTKNVVIDVVDGVAGTVNTVVNTAANMGSHVISGVTGKSDQDNITETETGNNLVKTIKTVGNDLVSKMKSITVKNDCNGPKQNGGHIKNGVSVLNIQGESDVSTRMLLPNNFLTSKHVYFVRYHPNGTNVYDYKFDMKGGNVNNLELRQVNSIWNNNNSVGSVSNTTISNGINVMNNIINNLSNSTQVGGYVRERIADKDEFYNEYKNYKLKYLSLKKNN